ncbi:hypothetical protein GCM10007858_02640 [Bradyrhizobium liaoningense]|nr:hypothetical protein GCM10007858_02640 [Bradyrhizobium liaoningense]
MRMMKFTVRDGCKLLWAPPPVLLEATEPDTAAHRGDILIDGEIAVDLGGGWTLPKRSSADAAMIEPFSANNDASHCRATEVIVGAQLGATRAQQRHT